MFQVSLSTLLTPPPAPGAGLPTALSGDFSAALAGLATTPDGTDVGKSAPAARQTPAESGKSLPTERDGSLALPAPADDWLDQIVIQTSSLSAQRVNPTNDAAGPMADSITALAADPALMHGKPVSLPIADSTPLPAADPIVIRSSVLSPPTKSNKPAAHRATPTPSAPTRKKADGAVPAIDPGAIIIAAPIAVAQAPDQAVGASEGAIVSDTSTRLTSTPIAAMPAPLSPPSDTEVSNAALGGGPATPSATLAEAASERGGDAHAPAAATTAPAMPVGTDGFTVPVAAPGEVAALPERRHTEPVATVPKAPARSQDEAGDRTAAAVKMTHRGDIRVSTTSTAARSAAPGTTGSSRVTISRASLQLPAGQVSSDAGKLSSVATTGSVPSSGDVTPHPPTPVRNPGAVGSDKATQPTTVDAAPPAPSRVATADATPAANTITAAPPQIAATPLPAGMLFGIALDQRAVSADRPSPRDEALQALSALTGAGSAAPVAAAAGGAQHGMLDMRRDNWPQAMIDRIDALRDAADATSTRITLMPDALGKVDVSLRHDGGTIHVHFAADTAQARTLIADAQPRLADAAQARGIRLGQTSVGAGGGEAGHQSSRQPSAPVPSRPVSATPAPADAAPDSSRLA